MELQLKPTGMLGETGKTKPLASGKYRVMALASPTYRWGNTNKRTRQIAETTSERPARGAHRVTGVSRGHSSRRKRAPKEGRTHPDEGLNGATCRMAGVNGRGCQRTCTYRPNAAVAERAVTSRSGRPGRPEFVLSVPALISRTAVYGPVCTVAWEGGAARLLPIPISVFYTFL